jgi:glycosyltransferase involved in cell wall biosynthesis
MVAAINNITGEKKADYSRLPDSTDRLLKILIDARKLYDGGIGVYTQNLIKGLLHTGEVDLSIIVPPGMELPAEWENKISVITDTAKPYSFDEMWNLAGRIDFSGIDLFHVPHYTLPYKIPVPAVITVHDLIHITSPEKKYYPWVAAPLIRSALKRASRVLTVSESSRKEISRLVKNTEKITSKLRVVPNAIDSFYISKRDSASGSASFKARQNGKYLMAIFSNLKPHKGLKDLLLAFQAAEKKMSRDLKLYLVGQGTEDIVSNPELLELTSQTKSINVVGSVSKDELAELYRNAEALIVPSLAEGFYLPVIEAQAMGTPIITRPVPSVLEIITSGDVVCKDFSIGALSEMIFEFAEKSEENDTIDLQQSSALQDHLKRFDQLSLAKTVLQIYREALESAAGQKGY